MRRLATKTAGSIIGLATGLVAEAAFRQIWRVSTGRPAPRITDPDRKWSEVLIYAAIHGMIIATAKAVTDKMTATGVEKIAGDRTQ